jgi:hypothetical protein
MLWRVPLLLAVCLVGILGAVMILGLEKFALYFPDRPLGATPRSEGLAYEDVRFPASDGITLHGWWIPAPGARVTLVWFHGNAGNIGDRVHNIGFLHRVLGANVFIFDYRGYGQSQGNRSDLSEEATYRDGQGALAYLRRGRTRPRRASCTLPLSGLPSQSSWRARTGGPDPGNGVHHA